MRPNILLIEDCPETQQSVCETLQQQGYNVSTISDAGRAFTEIEEWARQYNLVIIEEAMAASSGLRLLREARSKRKDLPVVVVTRNGDWDGYALAVSEGATSYMPCPVDRGELLTTVEEALRSAS
jgi:DNA-binding NtrC family response regulator